MRHLDDLPRNVMSALDQVDDHDDIPNAKRAIVAAIARKGVRAIEGSIRLCV